MIIMINLSQTNKHADSMNLHNILPLIGLTHCISQDSLEKQKQ